MGLIAEFTVYGDAKPQGSTRTWNRRDKQTGEFKPAITHSNRESLFAWRGSIRAAMQQQAPNLSGEFTGALAVKAIFYLHKPPSVAKKRAYPTVAPDLDKLLRALNDGLESIVCRNDAQIVHAHVWKLYTTARARLLVQLWEPEACSISAGNPFTERLPFANGP